MWLDNQDQTVVEDHSQLEWVADFEFSNQCFEIRIRTHNQSLCSGCRVPAHPSVIVADVYLTDFAYNVRRRNAHHVRRPPGTLHRTIGTPTDNHRN